MNQPIKMSIGTLQLFEQEFSCTITTLPKNVFLLGWSAPRKSWLLAPVNVTQQHVFNLRIPSTISFLNNAILPKLPNQTCWMPFCFYDGWRERNTFSEHYTWVKTSDLSAADEWCGGRGEIPLLTPQPFKISRNYYAEMFASIRSHAVDWDKKLDRAIFCGKNHGESANFFPPLLADREHPRQYLQRVVEQQNFPADIHLDQAIPQSEQIKYKYVLDIDGYARTWDAWAWKMQSGSLALSAESPWESFFTRLFTPWVHYVPIANDFSDLAHKLAWCAAHDAQCKAIAQQALLPAQEVYAPSFVADTFAQHLQQAPNP